MNGDIMEGGMQPDLWEMQRRVQALEARIAKLERDLQQHEQLVSHYNYNHGGIGGHGFA